MSERENPIRTEDPRQAVKEDVRAKRPDMYMILLLNDDYTPRDFVVWILMRVFFKNENDSKRIMLEAHTKGKSIVDCYTYDIATTKIKQVKILAEKYEHPLKCILEVQKAGS
ncbi:MAG: ATP-dependent Clp protease adaptor ClpS [Candidatus Dadabacteria bacterium]|nr:ATP-dependent Clp protease adaptor ClpS [Candidatus Dadabacteria bacterium]MCY4261730.1 ATP-dependent Clp protease adaptor ClpS [Candidatus Dadabacteria bacterium]